MSDVLVDLLHQLAHAGERPAPNRLLGDKPEPALNLVEPTGVGRRVMDEEARMAREPGFYPWMFVGGVVVRDQMDFEVGRNVAVEVLKEREKFLMAMARLALRDDRTVEHVERRKQRGGAVSKVVVGYAFDISQPHRQYRLGALQRLNLALFVHAQDQRLVRRVEVEADYVANLLDEERIGGELKALGAMRLQSKQREVARHCSFGDAGLPGHRAHAPVAFLGWPRRTRLINPATCSSP